jgi:OHCU decarboxylase
VPSKLPKALFIEVFGRVWEHSPWIAEATYDAGIGPAQDTAEGLHAAMTAIMRKAGPEQQKALLAAHPDLAGKLAAAGELTPESTGEQASAGLDRLTGDERVRFTALNEAYKARFGIPFIMAVKGASKAAILDAFETRLKNTREQEFATALGQVETISLLRLKDLLPR